MKSSPVKTIIIMVLIVGGLIADAKRTTIKNTRASSATINAPNSDYVGGLVGKASGHKTYSTNTTIYATSHDHVHRLTSISGRLHVGGVVGYMEYGTAVKNMSVSLCILPQKPVKHLLFPVKGSQKLQNGVDFYHVNH